MSGPGWWEMFTFAEGPVQIVCHKCGGISPSLEDPRAAAEWVAAHHPECEASP